MPRPRDRGGGGRLRERPPRGVMLSKKLSYLLRHGAEKEGLKLDQNGYANCADLLQWRDFSSLMVTFRELESVVATNDKKRFQLVPIPSDNDSLDFEVPSSPYPIPGSSQFAVNSNLPSAENADPSKYLIRASQGHSIAIESAALLTPILPSDEDFPSEVVHGTNPVAWKSIQASGGLSKMGRRHVHFARGLGSTYKVKPHPEASALRKGAGAREQAQENDKTNEEGVPEIEEEAESKKVISGLRKGANIFIWVDVKRSMEMGGLPWWRSANEVILTEGNDQGIVPLEFVKRVVQRNKGCIYTNEHTETASFTR